MEATVAPVSHNKQLGGKRLSWRITCHAPMSGHAHTHTHTHTQTQPEARLPIRHLADGKCLQLTQISFDQLT